MTSLILFLTTLASNAAFTLNSRARNSGSITRGALFCLVANSLHWFVLRQVIVSGNSISAGVAFVAASVLGGSAAQWFSIRVVEKEPVAKPKHKACVAWQECSACVRAELNGTLVVEPV